MAYIRGEKVVFGGVVNTGITPSGTLEITENGTHDVTNYASAEVNIGGGNDPVQVYKATRPKDWLNMLGTGIGENYDEMQEYYNTHDNEIRLLFHLSPPNTNLFCITCKTIGSGSYHYNVSYAKANGEVVSIDMNRGTCQLRLDYDDFGNETSKGFRQVVIVIKPQDDATNLSTFEVWTHSGKYGADQYTRWNIVELMGKCTSATQVRVSKSAGTNQEVTMLKYYSLFGSNNITDYTYMFKKCYSLIAVTQLDTSNAASLDFMFQDCRSLKAIPQLNTSNAISMYGTFSGCFSLTTIPLLDTSRVENMYYMFQNCYSLETIPQLDTSSVTNMTSMFYGCSSLTTIPQLDTSKVENMMFLFAFCDNLQVVPQLDTSSATVLADIFYGTYSLTSFSIKATNWAGVSFKVEKCSLDYEALLNLLANLPAITSAATITLRKNVGSETLEGEITAGTPPAEYTQAVANGWTIAL